MPARRKTAAELIRQRAEEGHRFLESPEGKAQEEAARLVAAYRAALDALTEAEGVEKVQTEVGRWWSVRSGGGLVKFLPKGRRWRDDPDGKTPFAVARVDGEPVAFAGIWEEWRSPEGEKLSTFATITTDANTLLALTAHSRPG